MPNWLINLVAKFSGVGKVWEFMDGKKAYGTGALAILGAALGLGTELAPLLAAHDAAGLFRFATRINSDPAYLALLGGFGIIAAAHKASKIEAAIAAPAKANDTTPTAG